MFAIFTEKHMYEIYINAYFEEYLLMAASEPALWGNVWNFVSGSHLKPSWLGNITKIPVAFKPKL